MTLTAQCASFHADRRALVDQVTLTVTPGEMVALLGPNGAGKSTLLKLLAGDVAPSTGQVMLDDDALATVRSHQLARRRAVLRQDLALPFSFTAAEVVRMGRLPHRGIADEREDARIVADALELLNAGHLAHRLYPTLSGGEQQRVQLARALTQIWAPGESGRYLLLDEPTSNLDLVHQHQALSVARSFARERGIGVLAILHDVALAVRHADRLALLKGGRLIASGSVDQVIETTSLSECFEMEFRMADFGAAGRVPVAIPRAHATGR
jgi:iron complex transport system ATP-binding protein